MSKSIAVSLGATAALVLGLAGFALAPDAVEAQAGISAKAAPKSVYLMCSRDGVMGKPGEPHACMEAHDRAGGGVCSGTGDAEICEDGLFSLCRSVGKAAGKPMSDQAGKGTFPDAQACMARCREEEAAYARFGGTCEGDITPTG